MDLSAAILEKHSREHTTKISLWIGADPLRISQLMELILQGEYRLVQRAAWILSSVAELQPALVAPYIPGLVKRLENKDLHIALKRNVYRLLQHLELPESIHGDLVNHCFASLCDPKEAAAVRAFAMSILARLAAVYPDIGNELKLVLEEALQQEKAPSFTSRARKVLKQLGKLRR